MGGKKHHNQIHLWNIKETQYRLSHRSTEAKRSWFLHPRPGTSLSLSSTCSWMNIYCRQNENGLLPLQLSCCLGLLLFVIASIIVIALIPIYLPYRNVGQVQSIQSSPQQVIYSIPSGTIYSTGSLTQAQLAYLVAYVIKAIHEGHAHFISFLVPSNYK